MGWQDEVRTERLRSNDRARYRKRRLKPLLKANKADVASEVVIGIDLSSTKLAIVAFVDGEYHSHVKKTFRLLTDVRSYTLAFVEALPKRGLKVRVAYIEEAVTGRGGNRVTIQQAYAMGAVRVTLEELGWVVGLVNVGTWKKQVVGRGNADKPAVSEWFRLGHRDYFAAFRGDQDVIDAWCVGRYGIGVVRSTRTLDAQGSMQGATTPVLLVTGRRRQAKE